MTFALTTRSDLDQLERAPLARTLQSSLLTSMAGWAADRQGLGGRLADSAWSLYQWTRRSAGYEKRQARGQWGVLPYVSPPRRQSYGGMGKFLYALTKPGHGHNVTAGSADDNQAEVITTAPAARGLNFARNGGVYLAEWATMHLQDERTIEERAIPAADRALQQEFDRG